MKRFVIVCFCLITVGFLALGWVIFGHRSSFQTGLDTYEGLPQTASDITIYENKNMSGIFIADFKIAEHDFVSFAATQALVLGADFGFSVRFPSESFS